MYKIPFDITFHPSWWHKNAGIDFSKPFFDDYKYRMDCDVRMRRALYDHFGAYGIGEKEPQPRPLLGTDLLAAGYLYSEIMGCDIVYQPDNSPQVVCRNLSAEDLDEVRVPEMDSDPVWARTQRQIDGLLKDYGRVETYINLQGIQNIALDLMGQELYIAYYTDPDEMNDLLRKITDLSVEIGRRFYALSRDISGGVTGIVRQVMPENYLTSNCSVEMVSNACYEEFLLPHDRRLAETFPCFGIHHCGPNMETVIDGYLRVPNLRFLEIGAGSDLEAVAKAVGDRDIRCCIRYSPVALKSDSQEEIARKTDEAVRAFGGDERLCFSCVGIDSGTEPEAVRSYLGVFRDREPIKA